MAKENIAFLVNLRKNTAVGTDREGRYYPEDVPKQAHPHAFGKVSIPEIQMDT